MFCEKCFTAIHQRWSYWEEVCARNVDLFVFSRHGLATLAGAQGGDDGGLKLCKRCYADIKASAHPNRILADLAHRNNLQVSAAASCARGSCALSIAIAAGRTSPARLCADQAPRISTTLCLVRPILVAD